MDVRGFLLSRQCSHRVLSLILLGTARMAQGRRNVAFRCFSEVAARLDRERILMDWILRLPLHDGLSRYWLAQGELIRARREAEALRELAAPPGERTYLALAQRTLAEIAMADGQLDDLPTTMNSVRCMLDVLGLDPADPAYAGRQGGDDERLTAAVDALVAGLLEQRNQARAAKDYATADAIRDRIKAAGIEVEDTPSGPKWSLGQTREER